MSRSLTYAGVFAGLLLAVPALAQTTTPAPTTPNSGAGIAGPAGSKNGPAAKPMAGAGGTTQDNPAVGNATAGDASKIPGKPGGKSGPAVKPPSQ